MEKAEKGNQWPLSVYGPFQGKPCLPGFDDKCFEEIRWDMYEAQKNGTVEQYVNFRFIKGCFRVHFVTKF